MTDRHTRVAPAAALLLLLTACGATGSTAAAGQAPSPGADAAATTAAEATLLPTDIPATAAPDPGEDTSAAQEAPGPGPAHARVVSGGWEIPDPTYTPGAVLAADAAKVCTPGYSKTVRNVPESEKEQVYIEYGITTHVPYQYEVDHDISLELGGSNDITNLWPEPNDKTQGNTKDTLENKLHELVCSGDLTLHQAQDAIKGDWTIAYRKYVGPLGEFHPNGRGTTTSADSSAPSATAPSTGTTTGSTSATKLDPQFATCTAAKAAGYGPYTKSKDPEYSWYSDRDGDGIVCE
jgi:hypothetical protein